MNTVEPLLIELDGNGVRTDENYRQRLSRGAWDETDDFIFHQSVSTLCEEISPYTIQEQYSEVVESELEPIRDVIPGLDRDPNFRRHGWGPRGTIYYVRVTQ